MDKLTKTALAMYEYMEGDIKRINHFMKVHGYAAVIGKQKGLTTAHRRYLKLQHMFMISE